MSPTLYLLVALLQPATPATKPSAPPSAAAKPETAPAAATDVAALREHVARLVDARAMKFGGPRLTDSDPRLGTLLAMLRFHAGNPQLPVPPHVREAKTLEDLWGGSTAAFVLNLMYKLASERPATEKLDEAACARACTGVVRAAGEDTVLGLTRAGWPMPPESAAAIRDAAARMHPDCTKLCLEKPVPAAACVEKARSQADLMTCWKK